MRCRQPRRSTIFKGHKPIIPYKSANKIYWALEKKAKPKTLPFKSATNPNNPRRKNTTISINQLANHQSNRSQRAQLRRTRQPIKTSRYCTFSKKKAITRGNRKPTSWAKRTSTISIKSETRSHTFQEGLIYRHPISKIPKIPSFKSINPPQPNNQPSTQQPCSNRSR